MSITPFLDRKQELFRKNEWLKQIALMQDTNVSAVKTYTLRVFLSVKYVLRKFEVKKHIRVQNTHLAFVTHIARFHHSKLCNA